MNSELNSIQRREIRQGVWIVQYILWTTFVFPALAIILIIIGLKQLPHLALNAVLLISGGACLAFLFLSGWAIFFVLMFRAKCLKCGWMLLRNPKSMGPSRFQAHPLCLKEKNRNAWSSQIVRATKTAKIMCLRCGEDYDIQPQALAK
jgi:hypothetical protein